MSNLLIHKMLLRLSIISAYEYDTSINLYQILETMSETFSQLGTWNLSITQSLLQDGDEGHNVLSQRRDQPNVTSPMSLLLSLCRKESDVSPINELLWKEKSTTFYQTSL
jgi:hypothetical protein